MVLLFIHMATGEGLLHWCSRSKTSPMPIPAAPPRPRDVRHDVDVLVVGGGINGAGIARDLPAAAPGRCSASRTISPAHTSSAMTKLIHGGLRYLEYYDSRWCEGAAEREVLLEGAALIWPLRFVMPHDPSMRPPG